MAFASVGTLGNNFSSGNNQSTLVITTSAAAEVGNFVVLIVAVDNSTGTGGASTDVSGVSDNSTSGPNNWQRAVGFTNTNGGAAQDGADISIWYTRITTQINNGGTITITFANSTTSDATAASAWEFTCAANVAVANTNTLANDAAAAGSLDATTANIHCLRVRAIASESNSSTVLTKTAAFDSLMTQAVSGAGTSATEMGVRGEFAITTGTGLASAPTGGAGAVDNASAYVAFREIVTTAKSLNVTKVTTATARPMLAKRLALTKPSDVGGFLEAHIRAAYTNPPIVKALALTATKVPFGGGTSKILTIAQVKTVRLINQVAHTMTIVQAKTARLINQVGRTIAGISQAKSVVLRRSPAPRLIVVQGKVISGFTDVTHAQVSYPFPGKSKVLSFFAAKTGGVTTPKALSIAQAKLVVLTRAISHNVLIAQTKMLILLRSMVRRIIIAQSKTAALTRVFAKLQSLSISQAKSLLLLRAASHRLVVTQTKVVSLLRAGSHRILVAQTKTLILLRSMIRRILIAQSKTVTFTRAFAKLQSLLISQPKSLVLRRAVSHFILVQQAKAVTLLRAVAHQLSILQAKTLVLVRGAATTGRSIIIAQTKDVGGFLEAHIRVSYTSPTKTAVLSFFAALVEGITTPKLLSIAQAKVAAVLLRPTLTRYFEGFGKEVTLTITRPSTSQTFSIAQAKAASLRKSMARRLTIAQAKVITFSRFFAKLKTINVAQSKTAILRRASGLVLEIAQSKAISLRQSYAHFVRVFQTKLASVGTGAQQVRSQAVSILQTKTVTLLRALFHRVVVAQAKAVAIIRVLTKLRTIAITQAKTLLMRRQAVKVLAVLQAKSIRIVFLFRIRVLVAQAKVASLFRAITHRISTAQAKVASVGRSYVRPKLIVVAQAKSLLVTLLRILAIPIRTVRSNRDQHPISDRSNDPVIGRSNVSTAQRAPGPGNKRTN